MSTSGSGDYFAGPPDVRTLLEREGHPTEEIEPQQLRSFLDDANLVVEEELVGTGQSDRRLAKIEARLAGHYILSSGIDSLRQATRITEHDGTLRWYGDNNEFGLSGTTLGEQAIEFDKSGTLQRIDEGTEQKQPSMRSLGSPSRSR